MSFSYKTRDKIADLEHRAGKVHPKLAVAVEKFFDGLEWPLKRVDDVRYYLQNRFLTRSHVLRTGLKPGKWHETEDQILHGCFEALVDYVEIQQAWMHVICTNADGTEEWSADRKTIFDTFPWYVRWFHSFGWRSRKYGLARLEWERNLRYAEDGHTADPNGKLSGQAISAQEQLDLYLWWKDERPARIDPYEHAEGKLSIQELRELAFEGPQTDQFDSIREPSSLYLKIEWARDKEDEENLKRLITIRRHLWT